MTFAIALFILLTSAVLFYMFLVRPLRGAKSEVSKLFILSPVFYSLKTGVRYMTIALQNDAIVALSIAAADAVGASLAVPAGTVAVVADTSVVTAAVSADGSTLTVTPVGAVGNSTTVQLSDTLPSGNTILSNVVTFNIIAPTVVSLAINAASAVFTKKP